MSNTLANCGNESQLIMQTTNMKEVEFALNSNTPTNLQQNWATKCKQNKSFIFKIEILLSQVAVFSKLLLLVTRGNTSDDYEIKVCFKSNSLCCWTLQSPNLYLGNKNSANSGLSDNRFRFKGRNLTTRMCLLSTSVCQVCKKCQNKHNYIFSTQK